MAKLEPKSVSQQKLKRYLELSALQQEFKELKDEIIEMMKNGLPCQAGPLVGRIKISAGVRRPKWKEEAITLAVKLGLDGDKWAEEVTENTPRGADSVSLEVFDRTEPVI